MRKCAASMHFYEILALTLMKRIDSLIIAGFYLEQSFCNAFQCFRCLMIEVGESRFSGRGGFATVSIAESAVVHQLTGRNVSRFDCLKDILLGRVRIDDPLSIPGGRYIILDWLSNSFNHSCSPNTVLAADQKLVAIQQINAGDEITFDYSLTVPPGGLTRFWRMRCICDTEQCRKRIGNIATIPKHQLLDYGEGGWTLNQNAYDYLENLNLKSVK